MLPLAPRPSPDLLGPAAAPPRRRPGSVRRTSTILMSWPEGFGTQLRLVGRCRDLLTPTAGEPAVLATADLRVGVGPDRTLQDVESDPDEPALAGLVGARGGGSLRGVLQTVVPEHRREGTPLYLLLDDVAGSTLIAGFATFRWVDQLPEIAELRRRLPPREMQGICSGFRPGSSALLDDGTMSGITHHVAVVPPLADADDPFSWHDLDDHPPMAMRRARRIDVWLDDGAMAIDAMFRDSCWDPDGTEVAVHEYQLLARADPETGVLTSVEALPRTLPYFECPGAAPNAGWLAGTPLRELRTEVLEQLRATDCCTHLNDALRSLAEVPVLAAALDR